MAAPPSEYKDRQFLAVIGDEVSASSATDLSTKKLIIDLEQDSVTGLLLAGIGV